MPPKNKKKKPSKNGFWQFAMECRDKHPNKTLNQAELQQYAATKWAALSKEQRRPYEERAQLARDTYNPARLTTDGLEVDEVEKSAQDKLEKQHSLKTEIQRKVKALNYTQILDQHVFLIIHINHLVYYPRDDKYFICELAISAVSLRNGVEDVFHRIVKPGRLPLGFLGGALTHSKETHQLMEVVQEEPYDDNTGAVFADMIEFIKKWNGSDAGTYVIYADEKTIEMITNVIDNFCYEFRPTEVIIVSYFQHLFFSIRNTVAERKVWLTETFSARELEKDVYSYTPNISCDFHEMSDISVYCSKSIVTRYGYILCDNCCADLNIQVVKGFHVPLNSKIEYSRPTSQASSVCANDEWRKDTRSRGGSISSTYEENYPALANRSSAPSVASFSSMNQARSVAPSSSRVAARIEQSFKQVSINDKKRDTRNLKMPEHGYNK